MPDLRLHELTFAEITRIVDKAIADRDRLRELADKLFAALMSLKTDEVCDWATCPDPAAHAAEDAYRAFLAEETA